MHGFKQTFGVFWSKSALDASNAFCTGIGIPVHTIYVMKGLELSLVLGTVFCQILVYIILKV